MNVSLPDRLEIVPLVRPPVATICVPGSKSITNRALVLAALCRQQKPCTLRGILHSEDTEVMVEGLRRLGFQVETDWTNRTATVAAAQGDRIIPVDHADLFCANSGTTMRFLTALVSLGRGRYRLDGTARMRERPIADLLDALKALGVEAFSEHGTGCPPVIVESNGLRGGRVSIKGSVSSQFLSALLLVAPLAEQTTVIEVEGPLVSEPYVTMTVEMVRSFGGRIDVVDSGRRFVVAGRQQLGREAYHIEPDASAASYFFAAAAITGGAVTVPGLTSRSLQGDVRFVEILEHMGCRVERSEHSITVYGGKLHGVDVDMNDISDTVMTLAAVACFADGPTNIRNVAHIRHKETDRLAALANELRRVGASVEERPDGLMIQPRPLQAAEIATYNDHRMAMSFALLGLRVPGIRIQNPACVEKTYADFFTDLKLLAGS